MKIMISEFNQMLLCSLCSLSSIRTGIIVFYTGQNIPEFSTEMIRDPLPNRGQVVDDGFVFALQQAIELNPSVHDGAIMCGRIESGGEYKITGWSYRLHPPSFREIAVPNKGSAFNSSLAMSFVRSVDRILFWSSGTGWCFQGGVIISTVTK